MEHWAAEKVGLPSSPPYLSLVNEPKKNNVSFLNGVSLASEGARILDGTNPYLLSEIIHKNFH